MIQRVLYVRAEESVIYDYHYTVLMRYGCNSADIDEAQCRITRTFDPYQLGFVRPYEVRDIQFYAGREGDLDSMCSRYLCEVSMRAPINVRDGNNVRACGEGLQDCSCCRGA